MNKGPWVRDIEKEEGIAYRWYERGKGNNGTGRTKRKEVRGQSRARNKEKDN